MADPILRLRVESKDYDSKIKRATDGLLAFEDSCHKAQKSMADADKATVDFVRQMGKMETVNRTAKGSVNELTKSFVELSAQYNRLTDEEKRSPFGKALSKSIDDLKGRIQQGKQELDSINRSLGETGKEGGKTGSILDSLAGKFGLNTAQLLKFGGALGAATTALNVAKDAFFASEANIDEWGRVVRSAQDVYEGFLTSINTGDISGFLSRIDSIVTAAREAYNALDLLETAKMINTPRISQQNAENERMRTMLRTGRYVAPEGQKAAMAEGTPLTKEQLKNIADHLARGMANKTNIVRGQVGLANNAIDKLYNEQAQILGMSKKDFLSGTSSIGELQKRIELAKKWDEYEFQHTTFGPEGSRRDRSKNPYEAYKGWKVFKDDGKLYKEIVGRIQERDSMLGQVYSDLGQGYRQINRATGYTPYGGGGGGGRGGRGGGTAVPKTEMQMNSEAISALNQEYISATAERRDAIRGEIKVLQDRNAEIQKLIDESNGKLPEQVMEGSVKALNQSMSELKKKQQDVTNSDDWQKLQTEIDGVQRKIDEIQGKTGPDMSLFNQENIQALISSVKQQMGSAQLGSELYANLANQMSDATALSNLITEFLKNGIDLASVDASAMWAKIFGGEDVATEELQKMLDVLNAYLAENGLDLMQLGGDGSLTSVKAEGKKNSNTMEQVSKGLSGLQSVMSGLQQVGLKIPSGIQEAMAVMQGLMSVVQGVQTVISIFSTTTETANTAAVIANTAAVGALTTVMAMNTATNAIPFLKTGGIAHAATGLVAGNDFSDNVPVMVSSGELILNRAQQGVLANALEGNEGMNGLHLETSVRAEEFRIMLNSNSMRRGRGEYVTTKTMR